MKYRLSRPKFIFKLINNIFLSLSLKTYKQMFIQFKKIIKKIRKNNITFKKLKWSKTNFKRTKT